MSNGTEKPLVNLSEEHHRLAHAVKEWWRESAREWWVSSGRTEARCDDEGESIPRGEGFKTGRRLICERCANLRLTKNVDWDLAIREPDTWFGPGVPERLTKLAEELWDAPQPSTEAEFTMRIGDVFDRRASVMVAGTPWGTASGDGDEVEVVGSERTKKARVTASTSMGSRTAFTLEGLEADVVKAGDVLQARRARRESQPVDREEEPKPVEALDKTGQDTSTGETSSTRHQGSTLGETGVRCGLIVGLIAGLIFALLDFGLEQIDFGKPAEMGVLGFLGLGVFTWIRVGLLGGLIMGAIGFLVVGTIFVALQGPGLGVLAAAAACAVWGALLLGSIGHWIDTLRRDGLQGAPFRSGGAALGLVAAAVLAGVGLSRAAPIDWVDVLMAPLLSILLLFPIGFWAGWLVDAILKHRRKPDRVRRAQVATRVTETSPKPVSPYAGFWRRVTALTIDFALVTGPPIALLVAYVTADGSAPGWVELSMGIWLLVVPFLAIVLPLRFFRGQTLGKRVMGIAVVSDTGGRLSWKQSLLRPVLYVASYLPVFVGFLACIWDARKRCFHDMIAHTIVVHKRALPEVGEALARAADSVHETVPDPAAKKATAVVETEDGYWMIGKARVLYAVNRPALDALGAKSDASPGQIMATAIVVAGFGQRKELTIDLDGTFRLSKAGEMKLASLYLYRDAQEGLLLTKGRIEGSPEFAFLGRLSKTDYALALCTHFGLDTGMLRV